MLGATSCVTWATSVPILVFLGLSVLDLGPMYATDRNTSDAHHHLTPAAIGHNKCTRDSESLYLHFNGHLPGEPGLAGVY